MIEINWKRKAVKQLKKVDHSKRKSIIDSVDNLNNWPDCQNVKRLNNHEYDCRLRVGRYRVFFNIVENGIVVIQIEEVKKRDEHTY